MVDDDHEGSAVCAGVDLERLGNAGEARVVVVPVLDVPHEHVEAVELGACAAREGGDVGAVALRGHRGVFDHVGREAHALDEGSALVDGLLMAVDVMNLVDGRPGLGKQVVVDLHARGAHDVEVVLHHEVIDLVHGTRRRVLDGKHPIAREVRLDGAKDSLEGLEVRDERVLEDVVGGKLGVGALDALAGNVRVAGKEVGGLLARLVDLRQNHWRMVCGETLPLACARRLHEELEEDLGVGPHVLWGPVREGRHVLSLARAVEHGQVVGALVGGHALRAVHAALEEVEDGAVYVVNLMTDVREVFHGANLRFFVRRQWCGAIRRGS